MKNLFLKNYWAWLSIVCFTLAAAITFGTFNTLTFLVWTLMMWSGIAGGEFRELCKKDRNAALDRLAESLKERFLSGDNTEKSGTEEASQEPEVGS